MKKFNWIIIFSMVGITLTGIGVRGFHSDKPAVQIVKIDTIYITTAGKSVQDKQDKPPVSPTRYDSLLVVLNKNIYAFAKRNDSLKTKLFLTQYKIEKVKYYLAIVDRKPSQIKYLKGWVRRAVE